MENALAAFNQAARDDTDLDNPDTLDAPPVEAISNTNYTKLVLELGRSLDHPATARLGRPALSPSDVDCCTPG